MHFRVFDLAAERCVWSIPPVDMVPWKVRMQRLVVRSVDNEGNVLKGESSDGEKLEDLIRWLFGDRRIARLSIHLAADESYAGHVRRFAID